MNQLVENLRKGYAARMLQAVDWMTADTKKVALGLGVPPQDRVSAEVEELRVSYEGGARRRVRKRGARARLAARL